MGYKIYCRPLLVGPSSASHPFYFSSRVNKAEWVRPAHFLRDHLSEIGTAIQVIAAAALLKKDQSPKAIAAGLCVIDRTLQSFTGSALLPIRIALLGFSL